MRRLGALKIPTLINKEQMCSQLEVIWAVWRRVVETRSDPCFTASDPS